MGSLPRVVRAGGRVREPLSTRTTRQCAVRTCPAVSHEAAAKQTRSAVLRRRSSFSWGGVGGLTVLGGAPGALEGDGDALCLGRDGAYAVNLSELRKMST